MSFLNKCVLLFCAFWCVTITSFATQNYFGLNQVSFDGVDYYLRWSANSPANTYIEDFLPKNSPLTRYSEKFSIYYITNKSFDAIIKAKDTDTTVTGRIAGTPVRILKNKMARTYIKKEKEGTEMVELEKYTLGSLKRAVFEGDVETGSLMSGQVAGMVHEERSLKDIIEGLFKEYEEEKKRVMEVHL